MTTGPLVLASEVILVSNLGRTQCHWSLWCSALSEMWGLYWAEVSKCAKALWVISNMDPNLKKIILEGEIFSQLDDIGAVLLGTSNKVLEDCLELWKMFWIGPWNSRTRISLLFLCRRSETTNVNTGKQRTWPPQNWTAKIEKIWINSPSTSCIKVFKL